MPKSTDKILIFGNGQIANFYLNYFNAKESGSAVLDRADITEKKQVSAAINKHNPTVIINGAGKTNLEWVKSNPLEALNVNVLGANNIAEECDARGIYYIFLSSGCIFESKNEHDLKTESSPPSPQALYSWTKVWAEQLIMWKKSENFKCLILRLRQPISSEVHHKNMLVKLLTFTRFVDTPNTGTVLEDLMGWTRELIDKKVTGILNAANEGWSTPYRIALLLKKYVLPELDVKSMTKAELDAKTPVQRVDAVLDVSKLKSLVSNVEPYEKRLEEVIKKLGENFKSIDKDLIKGEMNKVYEHTKLRAEPNTVWPRLFE